jgi:hypothetical protein
MLTCPNTNCARVIYSPTIRRGEVWMKCNVAEKQRHGACPAHWLNITLPADARLQDLAAVVGMHEAVCILFHQFGSSTHADPYKLPVNTRLTSDPTRPVHIQIAARARDEHHLRYAPIAEVLRALQIST